MSSTALVTGRDIGRYFTVVSTTSSLALVIVAYLLVASNALAGRVDLDRLAAAIGSLGLREASVLALAVLLVGLIIHPLQYAIVQLLEGYWGAGRLVVSASAALRHRRTLRVHSLEGDTLRYGSELGRVDDAYFRALDDPSADQPSDWAAVERYRLALIASADEADRIRSKYPVDYDRIMPTELGNRLRRAEDLAGAAYGIDSLAVLPHMVTLADGEARNYFDDSLTQQDTAARFVLVWGLAALMLTIALWDDRAWLLLAAIAYLLAWISYRGAVTAAEEHGAALMTLIDLTRFDFYASMGVKAPATVHAERILNGRLMELVKGESKCVNVAYCHAGDAD